tara:strand:+ start:2117 stop:2578 length:462 start_codon:yes stop_codon:yes gene_type:complete
METDDIPLVAKKYSTFSNTRQTPEYLLATVARQQLGLIIEWCVSHGVETFNDTHRHTIVQKNLSERIDEFRMAKDDFFKSVGVSNIDEMNEFSQGWDGFKVNNMNELVVKVDKIDDLEVAGLRVQVNLDNIEEESAEARLLLTGMLEDARVRP